MTSLHADEAFLEHYQFSHDPFVARVPGFRFYPAQRKPVLGQLHHLARYSQLLLLVTGPLGSGKTLLRQALVASTNKQTVQCVVVSARDASDVGGLLHQVAQGLGVQQPDVPSILAQVEQLALSGQEVYLLIDDAEQLADASLNTLLALAGAEGETHPHVFLFAETDLLRRLEQLSDAEERFHAIELQPYSEEEAHEYLAQRLDGAGQGIDLLSNEQFDEIYQRSQGWPGAINQVARDVLVDAMLVYRGVESISAHGVPKKHLLALVVVALALVAAWLMQDKMENTPVLATEQTIELIPKTESAAAVVPQQPAGGAPAVRAAVELAGTNQSLQLPLVSEAQPVIREPLAQASGMEDEQGATTSAPEVTTAPVVAPAVSTITNTPVADARTEVVKKPISTPAPVPHPVAPKPAVAKKAPPAADKSAPVTKGNWYTGQAAGSYTLQIFGSRSEAKARSFVSQNGGQYRYFKKLYQGQLLYVVTFGQFANRAAAQAAIKTLPASVQAGKPWARSFASIQREVARER